MGDKRVRIPDVDVKLTAEEIAIAQTRQFQRLFYLKQLGLAYLVYPAATHTRGSHSIQCLHEASKILNALDPKPSPEEGNAVRAAALLHDIGHIPFSHTLEDEHAILPKHDRPERLAAALDLLKKELEPKRWPLVDAAMPILNAISEAPGFEQDWKSDVVGNTVCADLLAYISTDAACTGIEKRPGYYRVYEYFVREGNHLCIRLTKGGLRPDIVSAIMDLLDMRYALTERVIFHHAKCTASAMLARAARLCGLVYSPDLLLMGDERFLDHLESLADNNHAEGAKNLVNCLRSRRLYQRVFKVGRVSRDAWDEARNPGAFCKKWRDGREVEQLLSSVEDTYKLDRGALVLWCPEDRAGMKLARAQVVWESAEGLQGPKELRSNEVRRQFPGVAKRVETVENQYGDLWTFWVMIDRRNIGKAAGVVHMLQDCLGVACDAVFAETDLRKIPGYAKRSTIGKAVAKVWQGLEPEVEQILDNQAALDGVARTDDSAIREAIRGAAGAGTKPKAPAKRDQTGLFEAKEHGQSEIPSDKK
jgi:HD superfamily phosphohydrolase